MRSTPIPRRAIACLLALSLPLAALAAKHKPVEAAATPAAAVASQADADTLLLGVYRELAGNHLRAAMDKADALVTAYPNFHLGHLIRGDLLLLQARPTTGLEQFPAAAQERLQNLRQEAGARMRALLERPDPKLVPNVLLQLRPDQKVAFVVDARRSRLYLYENDGGAPRFVADYYISQGKLGVYKIKEGDQRTPLGVYTVTSRLQGQKLPDFYGSGALPISYPNEWDRLQGRSGSGIWLHGVPSGSYSRPPMSSDGCVVLTNADLLRLSQAAEVGKTPVVIASELKFVTREKLEADRKEAGALFESWRRDMESRDVARLRSHYSSNFRSDASQINPESWITRQANWLGKLRQPTLKLRNVGVFRYPGESEMLVTSFVQEALVNGRVAQSQRLRQYWTREGQTWRIVAESRWQ
jgi:murein L,D-transpeptidase YafK